MSAELGQGPVRWRLVLRHGVILTPAWHLGASRNDTSRTMRRQELSSRHGRAKTRLRADCASARPRRQSVQACWPTKAELVGTLIETARFSEAQRREIDKLADAPGRSRAGRPGRDGRRRFLSARIWPVERGGGAAALPRRGAAAHSRCRHGRPADRRHGRLGATGRAISASPTRCSSTPRPSG